MSVLEGYNCLKTWKEPVHGISFHSLNIRASEWICSQFLTHTFFSSFWIRIYADSMTKFKAVILLISDLDYSVIEVTKRTCFMYSDAHTVIKTMYDSLQVSYLCILHLPQNLKVCFVP